jgi:rhamnosyltransferase subunit B
VSPFVCLGLELVKRGHDVILLTHDHFVHRFANSGLQIVPFDNPGDYLRFCRDGLLLNHPRTVPDFFRRHVMSELHSQCRECISIMDGDDWLVVTSETPGLLGRLVAEKLHLPCVSILLYPSHVKNAAAYEQLITGALSEEFREIRLTLGLAPIPDFHRWWQLPLSYLAFWPSWFFRIDETAQKSVHYAGFVWAKEKNECALAQEIRIEGDVIITGGSAAFAGPDFFQLSIAACATMNLSTLVVGRFIPDIPKPPGADIRVVSRVSSLSTALRQFRLVLHHGGLGTIGQSFEAGVPQLILARGGDRPDNANQVSRLGAGEYLPPRLWNTQTITSKIVHILSNSHYIACARSAGAHPRPEENVQTCCKVLEDFLTKSSKPRYR